MKPLILKLAAWLLLWLLAAPVTGPLAKCVPLISQASAQLTYSDMDADMAQTDCAIARLDNDIVRGEAFNAKAAALAEGVPRDDIHMQYGDASAEDATEHRSLAIAAWNAAEVHFDAEQWDQSYPKHYEGEAWYRTSEFEFDDAIFWFWLAEMGM